MYYDNRREVSVLLGMKLTEVDVGDNEIFFKTSDGKTFKMYHKQDCCENVHVEDIVGDVKDLVGSPIVEASEECSSGPDGEYGDSSTWTFYKFGTQKGSVTIRWFGSSNGHYSESVDFYEV